MTGPGRPGREDQASLSAMAAAHLGWDYPMLLQQILDSSSLLHDLRHVATPAGFRAIRSGADTLRDFAPHQL